MDGVNEPNENGKILNLLDPDDKNKPLDESCKTGQTSRTKMAFYSIYFNGNFEVMLKSYHLKLHLYRRSSP
ncbi:hypothetical protein Hanom_Chr06g00486251 [Helianthus anomalus]